MRFDSPSRSRRRAATDLVLNDGALTSLTTTSGPRELLSTSRSRMMSLSSVTRGVMSMITPTSLYWNVVSGFVLGAAGRDRREGRRWRGNLLAEPQRHLLPFRAPQLRLGEQLRVLIGRQHAHDGRRHGEVEIGRADAVA